MIHCASILAEAILLIAKQFNTYEKLLYVIILDPKSDQIEPIVYKCPDNYFKCPGNYCIPFSYLCDGGWHCPDGEDEVGCGKLFYTDPIQ